MNIGNYATTPLVASSLLNNTPRPGARAVMIAIQGWGNLAGVPASVSISHNTDCSEFSTDMWA